jgi:hypothetical protein
MSALQKRPLNSPIILSILPHFVAALLVADVLPVYAAIITVSSTLHVAWHWQHEPAGILFTLNYGAAAIRVAADCWVSFDGGFFTTAATLNAVFLTVNQGLARVRKGPHWDYFHSILHTLNVVKTLYILYLIRCTGATGATVATGATAADLKIDLDPPPSI